MRKLYQAVLEQLQLQPDEVIASEKSPNGVAAAKHSALLRVAVSNALTAQLPLDQADMRITSLAAVPLDTLLAGMTG